MAQEWDGLGILRVNDWVSACRNMEVEGMMGQDMDLLGLIWEWALYGETQYIWGKRLSLA